MQFFDLKTQLKDFITFSIQDIEKVNPAFHKQRLSEWQKQGYIKKIRQGFYMFSDTQLDEKNLFLIANKIYRPSYISLEMALSWYHLIPEAVYEVTSVTSQKTQNFKTKIGSFNYRHIKPALLFGYRLQRYNSHTYAIAEVEKAVLDYFYFHARIEQPEDFNGLRLNIPEFITRANINRLKKYLAVFHNQALTMRVNRFLDYVQYA